MSNVKIIFLIFAVILLLSCGDAKTQETSIRPKTTGNNSDVEKIEQMLKKSIKGIEKTIFYEYVDPKNGLTQVRYPIPESWNVNGLDNPIYMEGPNNLIVHKTEKETFFWSNDPMMQQTMQMSGKKLVQPLNNNQILNQFVRPNAENQGYKFLKSYELPEVAGLFQRVFNAMVNTTGSQREVEALGTEWETSKGKKSLIVMVRYQILDQQALTWTIQTTELESEPGYFKKAKNAYIYSFANAQLNPQWIQYMNGKLIGNIKKSNEFWNKAAAQSAAAHQQRMNAIASRGQISRSIGNTYSEILDISHKGYLDRSSINDAGHSKTIREINETTLIGNHETGEQYYVPSGSNFYWISDDGTYIGTDNSLFNPNTDNRMNDKEWTKFAIEH